MSLPCRRDDACHRRRSEARPGRRGAGFGSEAVGVVCLGRVVERQMGGRVRGVMCKKMDLIGQVVSEHMLGDRQVSTLRRSPRPTAIRREGGLR